VAFSLTLLYDKENKRSEERKRGHNRYNNAADCQKNLGDMSSEKDEEKKKKKNMVALLGREEIIHETILVSHCLIVQTVPNAFSSLSSRAFIWLKNVCSIPFDNLNVNKQA
jgi:hypothetical protein